MIIYNIITELVTVDDKLIETSILIDKQKHKYFLYNKNDGELDYFDNKAFEILCNNEKFKIKNINRHDYNVYNVKYQDDKYIAFVNNKPIYLSTSNKPLIHNEYFILLKPKYFEIIDEKNNDEKHVTFDIKNDEKSDENSDIKNDEKCDIKNDEKCDIKNDIKNDEKNDIKNDEKCDIKSDIKNDEKDDIKSDIKNDDIKSDDIKSDDIKNDEKYDIKSDEKCDIKNDEKCDIKSDENSDIKNDEKCDIKSDENSDIKNDENSDIKNDEKCDIKNDENSDNIILTEQSYISKEQDKYNELTIIKVIETIISNKEDDNENNHKKDEQLPSDGCNIIQITFTGIQYKIAVIIPVKLSRFNMKTIGKEKINTKNVLSYSNYGIKFDKDGYYLLKIINKKYVFYKQKNKLHILNVTTKKSFVVTNNLVFKLENNIYTVFSNNDTKNGNIVNNIIIPVIQIKSNNNSVKIIPKNYID